MTQIKHVLRINYFNLLFSSHSLGEFNESYTNQILHLFFCGVWSIKYFCHTPAIYKAKYMTIFSESKD
jgi:hypothetical protein